jgi:hypothetical protein
MFTINSLNYSLLTLNSKLKTVLLSGLQLKGQNSCTAASRVGVRLGKRPEKSWKCAPRRVSRGLAALDKIIT